MQEWTSRTSLLLTEEKVQILADKTVAVFGVGGVGGYACEALARVGIGHFILVDNDIISVSNINRQIIATTKTVGLPKVEVMRDRILEINPNAIVEIHQTFLLPSNSNQFDFNKYDYVVDAVDTISAKIEIIVRAQEAAVPVISSMGAGNKLDPTRFEVVDINQTSICPLAKVMRRELKKRNITKCKVVYSQEQPITPNPIIIMDDNHKQIPGSISFIPSVVGLIIASEVVKDIIK